MTAALNRIIHSSFRAAGIADDGDKRALYVRVTNEDGLTKMTDSQKDAVIAELRRLGAAPARRPGGRARLSGRYAKKLQAVWISAYNLGVVPDRDDAALEGFVKRQTGLDRERFLHVAKDANAVIGAIKARMARDGGVDWSIVSADPDYARAPGFKIAWAQWLKLGGEVHATSVQAFWSEVESLSGEIGKDISDKGWQRVMNAFGPRVRAILKQRTAAHG